MALDFNTEPYFDDYNAEKDFYRILFRPSYAVQARELTQLQTILQNQVSRFGDHVFKNGSQVIPGSVNVDNKVHFIKLEQFTGTVDVTTYIETLKNKIITGETSGVKMRVLDTSGGSAVVDELTTPTLYCKIEGTAEDTVTNRLQPGENIIAYTEDNLISSNFRLSEDQLTDISAVIKLTGSASETPTTYTGNVSSDVIGYGYSVDVGAGIYYIDGTFARNSDLKLYVGRFSNTPSCRVGFRVTEETVAPEDDESILDNATGSYNFAAPGAHRYKISLSLVKLPLTGTDTFKFIELVRIVNGRVQQKITSSSYAELEKSLARRTYDESGNYEVNKFKLSIRDHINDGTNQGVYSPLASGTLPVEGVTYGDQNLFCLVVDPGKAYIQGYEVESTVAQFIDIGKAREIDGNEGNHIQRIDKQTVGLNLGNYVDVENLYNIPDIQNFEKVYLVNSLQPRVAQARAVVSGGIITSVVVEDGGYGYSGSWTESVSFAVSPKTTTGANARLSVTVVNGVVTAISVTAGGADYSNSIPPDIVLTNNITLGTGPATSNIVGTARTRSIQISDTDTIKTKTSYKLSLFDIQMFDGKSFERDVKCVAGTRTSGNFSANIKPLEYTIPGTATGSTASNLILGQGTVFNSTVQIGDIIFLNDQLAGTVSQVTGNVSGTELGNFAVKLSGNSLVNQTNARITVFSAKLHLPTYESLLFPVGQSNIKTLRGYLGGADNFKNSDIIVRRKFPIANASNNRVSWELNIDQETFLSDEEPSNYLLVNAVTKLPVPFTTDTASDVFVSFDNDENRTVVTFNNVPAGDYYLIASIKQITNAAQESTKSLNKIDGEMIIENRKIVNSNSIELTHGDIFKLVSVEMTPDDGSYTFNEDQVIDITHRYTLDNGQRSSYYTYGKLNLKPGQPVPNGPIRITYWFFTSSNVGYGGNYFSVDSYVIGGAGIKYEEIPSYYSTDPTTGRSRETSLTDLVDFRPVLTTTNGFYPELPMIGSDMGCPRANYVGRIDKIALDSFGKYTIITGVPSASPKEPDDPKEGMVLATVKVPAYTKTVKDVVVTQRDNRRYTMRDIGRLERRITNLEYYVSLSLLEKDTAQLQIIDAETGLDRFKNGFIVDQFTGHGVGDVKNQDYKISVDSTTKTLRPMHYTNAVELVEDLSSGSDRGNKTYQKTGDLITLPYSENAYIFNNNATRTMDIHAISMGAFNGQVTLFPEGDNWKSVTRRPDLTVVDDNNYDAIKYLAEELGVTGTKWGEWETNWLSAVPRPPTYSETWTYRGYASAYDVRQYENIATDWTGYQTRPFTTTTLDSSVNAQSYGDRVVDMSYIPYMRSRPVTFIAQNLKARTRFYPFFDNVSVKKYVKPADVFKVTRVSNSLMSFDLYDLQNNILVDDPRRSYNGVEYRDIVGENGGRVEPSFGIGDVITNVTHNATNVISVANLTVAATTFTLVVQDSNNIKVGNHVMFYNMDYHNAVDLTQYNDYSGTIVPTSLSIVDNTLTSKQLNLKVFKVVGVNGGSITLASADGSAIQPFDAYSTDSYDDGVKGKLYRLKASGVVAHGGTIYSNDVVGPIQQDIHVVNIKNGFGVGETLTGTVTIGSSGLYNGFVVNEINGAAVNVVLKANDTYLTTDDNGTAVGVFYIPETDELSFRTGERTFTLTDNMTDSNAKFDSSGSAVYYAQGISLDKERTIVSSRTAEFIQVTGTQDSRELGLPPVRRVTNSSRLIYQYVYDPLAQTFTINSPGGTFLTSIDLYFSESGRRPVSIELRPTDNGVPSSTKVIPFSKVTKTPAEINVSEDSSLATTYKFKSPVYLQDGETYAFVVLTDEPGAQVWVSEMGQKDILTDNTIAGQPLTGSLYASQNAREWEIHTLLDMKFVLRNAKFNTNVASTLFLKNTPPEMVSLGNDPFTITNGKTLIRVKAKNHGLQAGQTVRITGVPEGLYGSNLSNVGIPHTLLNANHTVYAGNQIAGIPSGIDKDSFIINLVTTEAGTGNNLLRGTTADFVTGEYGGSTVSCTRGFNVDMLYLKTSDLIFADTKIDYYAKTMKSAGDMTTDFVPLISNSNFSMATRMMIPSFENYYVQDNVKVAPLQIKAIMASSNENVSPVIDMQQLAAYAVSNLINSSSASEINVADIDTRVLLTYGDIENADVQTAGTGTVTSSTSSNKIQGNSTLFKTQVYQGNKLYKEADNTLIGTVLSVATDDGIDAITLTGNAAQTVSAQAFYITTAPTLSFLNNAEGFGKISTNIDTADNLLSSASVGKVLIISGVDGDAVSPKLIDGTYTIKDVQIVEDKTLYAGNVERDICIITLNEAFRGTASIDMIADEGGNFKISILDKYIDDTAPYGVSNDANYVTRTLSLAEPANNLKAIFESNIPNNTELKVYYRTWTGNADLKKVRWIDSGFVSDGKDVGIDFIEREANVSNIPSFNNVQMKIVFKSTKPTSVPQIRNLRVLALT
jgi:hypothetical protein